MKSRTRESKSQPQARWKGAAFYTLYLVLITLGVSEVATRMMTSAFDNGTLRVTRFPLLPYRPTATMVSRWLDSTATASYLVWDRDLGWALAREAKTDLYETNSQGIRASRDREFSKEIPVGKFRIVAVGDSFVHGDEVKNDETWLYYLEEQREELEILNFGVSAYGTDQALLRWRRDASQFDADLVILGIWPDNMLRNLNLFRYYLGQASGYLTKPRFVLDGGELSLVNAPVVTKQEMVQIHSNPKQAPLLEHDYWFNADEVEDRFYYGLRSLRTVKSLQNLQRRRGLRHRLKYGDDPKAVELTVEIASRFAEEVRAVGSTPLILVIPERGMLEMQAEENSFPAVQALRARGLDVIDMGPPMAAAASTSGMESIFLDTGTLSHFSPNGNRVFALELAKLLRPWIPQ